ncbi:beta-galactosidase [Streptomyces scabiei]|uniref:beta-galactosidase n=1 Tax=Streptomyces scabiei TaxID=1930 RepID=UPI0029A961D3|nr:beta-galactosidase [Streptomyces scabiei]MDX3517877.1 beta-galactosidase [Streptomyces scabiei]
MTEPRTDAPRIDTPRITTFHRRLPGVVYGGDYNPEQWPREVWQEDVRLMRDAGVRLVSLGVFSWSVLEPADGRFDFSWLDEIMDLLWANGIHVNLATPNAAPPPWLATDFPEILSTDRQGVRHGIGSRGHLCPSSLVYHHRSRRIARALAERYGTHPALAMWHIGNEYHSDCFCDLCDDRFRTWLRQRYGTLDELNRRWGTAFWSQRYSDWAQVHLPRPVRGWVNPSRELDFSRFTSDLLLELVVRERELLHEITPDVPATTNFFGCRLTDSRRWAKELDVVAFDCYPDPGKPHSMAVAAFQYDLMRSLGEGRPWMLMEQAAGAVSQWQTNQVKQPGRMRLGSYQAVAHGSDAVMFFQWRASRQGQEKFHSAMLPHGGVKTRTWQEVKLLGNELRALDEVATARTDARVAIVWDWQNWWAVEGCAHPDNTFDYRDTVARHHRALWNSQVAVDVVTLDDDLSPYRVLVVPNQYLMTDRHSAAVRRFVEDGGHLVVSYFSGIVDEDDRIVEGGYPGALRGVIGAHVQEFSPLPAGASVPIRGTADPSAPDGSYGTASAWQDDLETETARPLAVYDQGHLSGKAAVIEHQIGLGRAVYVGTRLDDDALETLVRQVLDRAAVRPVHAAPRGVEVTERRTDTCVYLFLLNHRQDTATVTLDRSGTDLLTGLHLAAGETLVLDAAGVAVVRSPSVMSQRADRSSGDS